VTAQSPGEDADDPVSLCRTWFRLREQAESLQRRWGAAESALIARSTAWKLSRRESAVLPEAGALRDVEAALDDVEARVHAAFEAILLASARSIAGVTAKLEVVKMRIEADCDDDVRRLLGGAINELRALDPDA
jgi:hypothetical protein